MFPTIEDILKKSELGNELEVIVVLDGYWPEKPLPTDKRVKIVHNGTNQGMRGAINIGVRVAKGKFIGRVDEHQMFGQGFDKILTETCEPNWIVTCNRFALDPVKWEVMEGPPVEFCKLIIDEPRKKFAAVNWKSRNEIMKDVMIGETMGMQGSFWIMPKKWWEDVIGELQSEGYGTHYQDSIEMIFKTWQAGGKMMLNKNTWHAHKHRSFNRTHNVNRESSESSFAYAIKIWNEYYQTVIRPRFKV